MDLNYDQDLLEKTTESKTKIRTKSNGGTMTVSYKATVTGYYNILWFREKYITRIIALIN